MVQTSHSHWQQWIFFITVLKVSSRDTIKIVVLSNKCIWLESALVVCTFRLNIICINGFTMLWSISYLILFPLQTLSQSELRQDCVLLHCWRTLSPNWIYPCAWPSAGAGVVIVSCKSVLMFFPSNSQLQHPFQHRCLCRYTMLNRENTNFPSFFQNTCVIVSTMHFYPEWKQTAHPMSKWSCGWSSRS